MDTTWIVVMGGIAAASWGLQALAAHRKKLQDQINGLQEYDDDPGTVHFPSMLYRTARVSYDYDAPEPNLFHVQRLGDGSWQKRASSATVQRWYFRECSLYNRRLDMEKWEEKNKDSIGWQPMVWPEMETAYQRFLRAPPTLQVYPRLRTLWEEDDEKSCEKERQKFLALPERAAAERSPA